MKVGGKTVLVHTDSKITLQLLKKTEETCTVHRPNQGKVDRNGTTGMESGI
jgi:hypothetical protein